MSQSQILLPGDSINPQLMPTSTKRRINPSIKTNTDSDTYTSQVAGSLNTDFRRKTASISTPHARYQPVPGDLVIAQIRGSSMDYHHLSLNAFSPPAILGNLAFENATKKSRPKLENGDLVYARVISANKNMEVELSCVNPSTGKADDMGELKGGMVFDVSGGLAERLLKKQVLGMEILGEKIPGGFEVRIGRNGRVWVDCPEAGAKGIVAIGKCLQEFDEGGIREKDMKKCVGKVVGETGLG